MKKLFSLLLALAMLLGCGALAEGVDYIGLWTMTSAEVSGMTLDPLLLGMQITMELNEGGVCVLTNADESENGTWVVVEGGVEVTDAVGTTMLCMYVDGALVAEEDGVKMIFTYGEATAPVGPVVLANVPEEDFEGQWQLTKVVMLGMTVTAEEADAYMAFVLSDGKGIYVEKDSDGTLYQLDMTYTITEVEETGTTLEMIYDGEEVTEPTVLMTLNMLDDGSLYMNMEVEGLSVEYYFERPVEEETAAE